jgi:protein-S-isoprenylcysteine O-methyltransferase Ste14
VRPSVQTRRPAASRTFALAAYLSFVVTTIWAIGFLADARVPTTIDGGGHRSAIVAALINASLLLIFAIQHSVMARDGFKRRLKRFIPPAAERSVYVLMSSLALGLVLWQWKPLPRPIWQVDAQPWAFMIWTVFSLGWLIVFAATFMIDHFDFLGIRQASWRGPGPYQSPSFTERWLYAWVRHPILLGLLIAFWATPRMTVGHLLFAAAGTAYIAVGLRFEERDLRRQLGPVYRDYSKRVPALIPTLRASARAAASGESGRAARGEGSAGKASPPVSSMQR